LVTGKNGFLANKQLSWQITITAIDDGIGSEPSDFYKIKITNMGLLYLGK
jgi:hypothetical protein